MGEEDHPVEQAALWRPRLHEKLIASLARRSQPLRLSIPHDPRPAVIPISPCLNAGPTRRNCPLDLHVGLGRPEPGPGINGRRVVGQHRARPGERRVGNDVVLAERHQDQVFFGAVDGRSDRGLRKMLAAPGLVIEKRTGVIPGKRAIAVR